MSWDATECFKAVCTAFCDFQRQPSEESVQNLQRQIDVILGLTSHGTILNEFTPKQLVYAETLSALVSVINDPTLKSSLYLKSLMTLSQLAIDVETKLSLQTDLNLGSSLTGFIMRHASNTANRKMVLQALLLLEKMTYGNSCSINNIYMVDLLKYLVNSIYTTASEFCIPSLGVLANLCRHSNEVKTFVKTMNDAKKFGKTLLSYLSNSNKTYSITSLSILTHLYLNDPLGDNMFGGQNLVNMVRLVFNVLVNNDDVNTRHYSVDLVSDFLKCEKTLKIITGSSKLELDIFQILNLLHSTDARTAVKVFDLLIQFCSQPNICGRVIQSFMKNYAGAETQMPDDILQSPAQAVLHWISRSEREDSIVQANLLSLCFLKELLTNILLEATNQNQMFIYASQVISILSPFLTVDISADDIKRMKQKFRKMACILDVLCVLSKDNELKKVVVENIDVDSVFNFVVKVLEMFSDDLNTFREPASLCKEEIILSVFRSLEFISSLKHLIDSGVVRYSSFVQNTKLIPMLSHGLVSTNKYLVHASLQIIAEGSKVNGFQSRVLGDTLVNHNMSRHEFSKSSSQVDSTEIIQPLHCKIPSQKPVLRDITSNANKHLAVQPDANIISLADRLSKGLEIKDAKVSEIMAFYEHKLSALIGREKHIQDILEAKSTTLTQTERLLSEYRCRHSQSEAECLKLCSLLQTSERKGEADALKIIEMEKSKGKCDDQIVILQSKVNTLESIATEHEELRRLYETQKQQLESLEKNLVSAQEEGVSLEAARKLLAENCEKLEQKLDKANDELHLKREEIKKLSATIKEKEKESKKLEKSLKETKDKVAKHEANIQELEQGISEKENKIAHLYVEVEKHSQIAAMIHNLTMGKMPHNTSE